MRAELSCQRGSHNVEESTTKRARRREQRTDGEGGCEGRRGLYVKGGRARCYLACSPDEISASSFRPSSPLLPRSSPASLPSSYAFFLFCFCPLAFFEVKTFSVYAIVRLLIALGFAFSLSLSVPLPPFFYLNLSCSPQLFLACLFVFAVYSF